MNNLVGRDPRSWEFPNSMIFWAFNPANSTMWKPAWRSEWEAENKEFDTRVCALFFSWNNLISLCLSFPSCSSAIRKSTPIFTVGVLSLNEEVPCTANESRYTTTRSINVIIGGPRGPIENGLSSLRERCGVSLLLQVNSWPFNATSAQFDTVQMCWSFNMVNIERLWWKMIFF